MVVTIRIQWSNLYNQLMSIEPDQIKKLRVRYLKCNKGELHHGEVLNFICVDPNCKNKGLICPVCQNTTHQGHQTLHLKIFLAQINRNLYHQEQSPELSGLSEYLRSLDSSKRQMQKYLKDMVEQLAQKVKIVQQKIEQGYCQLRKVILAQSTVSMRLPELYRLLTQPDSCQDEAQILKQISRYSELLQYKDNKLITVDSSKNLVVQYASKAGSFSAHLTTVVSQVTKIFNNLPLQVSKFGVKDQKVEQKNNLIFSSTQKTASINITDDKIVQLKQDSTCGIVFTKIQSDKETQKAAFKITELPQGDLVSIGVANPQNLKAKHYQINIEGQQGLYGLCSLGFLLQDLAGQAFMFSKGDTIEVSWTPSEKKLVFSRRHSIEKCETYLPIQTDNPSNFNFYVVLTSQGTKIELVD